MKTNRLLNKVIKLIKWFNKNTEWYFSPESKLGKGKKLIK